MPTSREAAAAFSAAIGGGAKSPGPAARVRRRTEIAEAQVSALTQAIAAIRARQRAMPAWHHGYESAVTAIELQIAAIQRGA